MAKQKKFYKTHAELVRTFASLISAVCALTTMLVVIYHL